MFSKISPKSEFSRNVLTLMTGTTIAQAIPIAISPILTRIYTPEDFGVFALFIAVTSILGVVSNGSYEYAIMLPKKDEDAINILALGFLINILFNIMLIIVIFILNTQISQLLNNEEIVSWLYFVPVVIFFLGSFNLLNYFNNRKKEYKDLAKVNVYKSVVLAATQLAIGFMKSGVTGLIVGQIFSQMVANLKLFLNVKKLNLFRYVKKAKIMILAKKYKNFFIFTSISSILNASSYQVLNILISSIFSITTLGGFYLVQRVFGIPLQLIGKSFSQVFMEQAINEKKTKGNSLESFYFVLKKMTIVSIPVTILFFYIEDLFIFVFGENWAIVSKYVQYLLVFTYIRLISSILSGLLIVYEKQKSELFINVIIMMVSFTTLYIFRDRDFEIFVKYFALGMSFIYLLFIYYYYYLAKGAKNVKTDG